MNSGKEERQRLFYIEEKTSMFGNNGRDWSVDVLRCLSCFLVCAVHATNLTYVHEINSTGSNIWLHHEVYRMLFASPTLLFVMISGIFFLSPERNVTPGRIWRKNILKMASIYVFWSLLYAFFRIQQMDPQPVLTFELVREQWLIEHSHLWYIPMMLGLYIISPILRPITASRDTGLFRYVIIIFTGALILWTIYKLPAIQMDGSQTKAIIDKTPMMLICQYPFWMLIGWIAYTYRPSKAIRIIIYIAGILVLAAGIYLNTVIGVSDDDYWITAITQKFSIFSGIKNIALFYFVLTVFENHKFSKIGKIILGKLSGYTLIIYLVHYMFLSILYDQNFLYSSGISPWIGVWVYAAIAYIAGGLLALIFHVFWDPIKADLFPKDRKKKRFGKTRSEKIYKKLDKNEKKERNKEEKSDEDREDREDRGDREERDKGKNRNKKENEEKIEKQDIVL